MSKMICGTAKILSQESLVLALEEMGFTVEVHKHPVHLNGYLRDTRKETAHVIVRQPTCSSNDIGWLQNSDDSWTEIISAYDRGPVLKQLVKAHGDFAEHVVAHAMKHHSIAQVVEMGYSYEIEEDGDILRVVAYA